MRDEVIIGFVVLFITILSGIFFESCMRKNFALQKMCVEKNFEADECARLGVH